MPIYAITVYAITIYAINVHPERIVGYMLHTRSKESFVSVRTTDDCDALKPAFE